MAHKYLVDLTDEEQEYLLDVIRKGKTTARRVARAHVLLRAATGGSDEEIAEALHLGLSTVHRTRQRFVDEGLTVVTPKDWTVGEERSDYPMRRLPWANADIFHPSL
ncbi:MAG: helix-turn-helix domain-containing protein, partial [Candidatus Competibacteraceae bacterium]|nr:helix-turn-helix domain-containing protein [Candidatus Competibacteraceae bacterium]